jgi:hypothetical protein
MSTVTVNWNLPSQRVDNTPLSVAEIAFTRFSLSFNGGPFTQLVDVPAPTATTTVTAAAIAAAGNYVVRSEVHDTQVPSKVSATVDTSFTIPSASLAAPKPVSGQTAVVS